MEWVYLYVAVMAEVVATSALKASESFTKPWPTFFVITGYSIAFYLLTLALNKIPLGVAYAIWSAFGVTLVTVIGYVRYGETLDTPALVGLTLIVAGVLILNLLSKSVAAH